MNAARMIQRVLPTFDVRRGAMTVMGLKKMTGAAGDVPPLPEPSSQGGAFAVGIFIFGLLLVLGVVAASVYGVYRVGKWALK